MRIGFGTMSAKASGARFLRGLVIATLVVLAPALQAPAAADSAGDRLTPEGIDAYMAEYLDSSALTGATVAVTHGTRVVHTAGYGSDAAGAPMRADTPMAVASVSKAFTALAVMQLVEEGAVELDTPVRDYLPEFETADPRSDEITVRQLLNQSSGMSDQGFREKSEAQPASLEEAVARLRTAELVADPGTESHYHNPNYHVAARIVEVVSGQPFADYLRGNVFDPLGMDDTTTVDTADDLAGAGVGEGHIAVLGVPIAVAEPEGFWGGAGGTVTTAEDMAAWLIAQNNQGALPDGERILSAEGIKETHTPSDPRERKGFGWTAGSTGGGSPTIEHGGVQFTFTAEQRLLPETGHGIAVMADSGLGRSDSWAILEGLTALAEDEEPASSPAGTLLAVDITLLLATAATVFLAMRGVRRAPAWVERHQGRPWWATTVRCMPYVVGVGACVFINRLLAPLAQGRDITWVQSGYLAPTLLLWLVVVAAACSAVLIARFASAGRRRSRE